MNSLICGANELEIGSPILSGRGRTDANAPESPQEGIPRDWHVGMLGLHFFENLGTRAKNNSQKHDSLFLRDQDWPK